jgi:hypothetical protein
MNTGTNVPSEHLVELCPVTFLGSSASQEDGLIKVNAFHGTRPFANDDKYKDILALNLCDVANRLEAAKYYGFHDKWIDKENELTGKPFYNIFSQFYAMRWKHARDTNEVVRINWAEEGQHRMFDWILIYTASKYTQEQPYLVPGSINEDFLRNQGLADLEEFKSEANTIKKSTKLDVIKCINNLLSQDLSPQTYNPLLEPIKASFRTLRPNDDIDEKLSGREVKNASTLIELLRNESVASKEDKRLSSHLSISDVLTYEAKRINSDIVTRWLYNEVRSFANSILRLPFISFYLCSFDTQQPILDRNIHKIPISKKTADLLKKLNEDSTPSDYRDLSPDPDFLKTKEMTQFLDNPREHANRQYVAFSLAATPKFCPKEDGGDKRWTMEEDNGEYIYKKPPPPFMNTLDGMTIDTTSNDLVSMNTQMVNFVVFFPVTMAATHADTEKRIKDTKYVLKHHLYPSKTQFNNVLPVYELFYGNEKCTDFFEDTMVDTTTAIFFAMMMNSVLAFDSNLERFERMMHVIKTDETSLGATKFKKRLGKNSLHPVYQFMIHLTMDSLTSTFSTSPIMADPQLEKNRIPKFFRRSN